MLFISHRGNLEGPDLSKENSVEYVGEAIDKGYHVVVDVWISPTENKNLVKLGLGDTHPQHSVSLGFLKQPKIIARAKTLPTFQILCDNNIHAFLDGFVTRLTTKGLVWTSPGTKTIIPRAVLNMPEILTDDPKILSNLKISGICSNNISLYRKILQVEEETVEDSESESDEEILLETEDNDGDNGDGNNQLDL